jgi:RNA recognition motif-containing protein
MASKDAAQAAISALNGTEYDGRVLNVDLAKPARSARAVAWRRRPGAGSGRLPRVSPPGLGR